MGLPGAGKGTQGKMMADINGMHLLSMSDIIRLYITEESRAKLSSGQLLDDDETIALFDQVLSSIDRKDNCVLDGFPRTIGQAEWLLKRSKLDNFQINHVIFLDASFETVKSRLQIRGRADDRVEVVERRFKVYKSYTQPLLDWYSENNIDVVRIDAEQTVDKVNQDVQAILDQDQQSSSQTQ